MWCFHGSDKNKIRMCVRATMANCTILVIPNVNSIFLYLHLRLAISNINVNSKIHANSLIFFFYLQ